MNIKLSNLFKHGKFTQPGFSIIKQKQLNIFNKNFQPFLVCARLDKSLGETKQLVCGSFASL